MRWYSRGHTLETQTQEQSWKMKENDMVCLMVQVQIIKRENGGEEQAIEHFLGLK